MLKYHKREENIGLEYSKRKSNPVSEALVGLLSLVAFITCFVGALGSSLHLFCPPLSKQHMAVIRINLLLVSRAQILL